MAYGANILKKEAAYYSLQNASIRNGILHIDAGGYATQQISISDLPKITDTLQFTCIVDEYSDRYINDTVVLIHARMTETQKYYNAFLFPVLVMPNKYECIFKLAAGEYDEMYVTISSKHTINFTLWELCPVAASEEVETIIDGVKQSLPRLLYDYNTLPLEVGQNETTVAVITARLLQNADLQGHFLMTFLASKTATLTLRFYDNEAEELFAPLYYDTRVGYNSVGVPHAYMNRLAGLHSFVVTAQIASGILTIDTRHTLFTIDGGYLAARELTIGMNVCDLTIKQTSTNSSPEEIWLIGIDAGEALIRKRSYSDQNTNVGFEPVSSLGKAKNGAIEFDGEWVYRPGSEKYTIETDEWPWYFWTDEEDVLWGQQGEDEETRVQLATDVVLVKACKGFSSIDYLDQDQGLVVAYLKKDGTAWYRQRIRNPETKVKYWVEGEIQITEEAWDAISVTRLNDYRISFQLSNSTHNLWMYTERTFVGQACPPEMFDINKNTDEYSLFYARQGTDIVQPELKNVEEIFISQSEGSSAHFRIILTYSQKIILRRDPIDVVGVSGSLVDNVSSMKWNDQDNSLEIVTRTDVTDRVSYGVTLNQNWFGAVLETINGYVPFDTLYSFIEKSLRIKEDEMISLNTANVNLVFDFKKKVLNDNTKESLVLPAFSSLLTYEKKKLRATESKETFSVAGNTSIILQMFNSNGDPI